MAGDLRPGDAVYTVGTYLEPRQEQFVLGSFLGDGYAGARGPGRYGGLAICHGHELRTHLDWKFDRLANVGARPPSAQRLSPGGFAKKPTSRLTTRTHPRISALADEFYGTGVKGPPAGVVARAGRLGLGIWFGDDGTALLVLRNFHRFMGTAEIVEALDTSVVAGKQSRAIVVILTPVVQLPVELEKLFVVVEHELPGRDQLEVIARGTATEPGELPEEDDRERLIDAAAGMTRMEAENAFSLSLVRHGRLAPDVIWELKVQALKKSGLLDQQSLSSEQKTRAAEAFDAEGQLLSAAKKLHYTRHPAFRAVTAVCGKIDSYVKGLSLPFPELGVRLIRQHKVDDFSARLVDYRVELEDEVANLDRHYAELKAALQSGRRVPLVGHGPRGSVRRARDGRPPRRRPRPGRRPPHRRLGCTEVAIVPSLNCRRRRAILRDAGGRPEGGDCRRGGDRTWPSP